MLINGYHRCPHLPLDVVIHHQANPVQWFLEHRAPAISELRIPEKVFLLAIWFCPICGQNLSQPPEEALPRDGRTSDLDLPKDSVPI